MRNDSFFAFLFMSLFFIGCSSEPSVEEKGEINFRFKAVYDGQPLKIFDTYNYPESEWKLYFTRLSFYLSDLTLKSADKEYNLVEIDYLNLTNSHVDANNDKGLEYTIGGVAPGQYTSFDFSIGVEPRANGLLPKDFPAGHILSSNAEYWTAWKSYIFFRPEGKIDFGNGVYENFALHLGGNESYVTITMDKTFEVVEGKETIVDVTIDMKKFFGAQELHDIKNTMQIHSLDKQAVMLKLVDNLRLSFQ